MQSPIHIHKTVSGNRLRIAFTALLFFIVLVAGLYYYFSFKRSHIPLTLEGTWVCQQYLDSIAAHKSVVKAGTPPLFMQLSFKKGWVDSVMSTGMSATYSLQLRKLSKGKYQLTRYSDTLAFIKLKKDFVLQERWSGKKWAYAKVDTAFKSMDRGQIFRRKLNKILIEGTYVPVIGNSLLKEVVFSDSGTVAGIRGVDSYKLCFGADCYQNTYPKDAIFLSNKKSTLLYAYDLVSDTLTIYTMNKSDSTVNFKPYWQMVRHQRLKFK